MKPFLPAASMHVEILTFTSLLLQSLPPVVKCAVPPLCAPSCHFLFSVWNETSLHARKVWQQRLSVMKRASNRGSDSPHPTRQMTCSILKVLCNMSFICRHQIVLDDTSITIHKPTLWANKISPVTFLYMSQSEMRRIETQLAFVKCWSRTLPAHKFHTLFQSIAARLRPFLLVYCHYFAFWVEFPETAKTLRFTGVYRKHSSRRINPPLSQIPSTMWG